MKVVSTRSRGLGSSLSLCITIPNHRRRQRTEILATATPLARRADGQEARLAYCERIPGDGRVTMAAHF